MLIIRDIDYEIDFSHGKIHELLGFDKKIYKEGINYATKIDNITKDIDQILIHCSLVSSSYQNNLKSDVIYYWGHGKLGRCVIQLSKFLNHTLATHNQVDRFFENINYNDGKGAFTLTLFERQ
jgi:hypothetical protein